MTNSLQTEIQKRKNAEKKIKRRFRCKKNRDNVIDFICPEKKNYRTYTAKTIFLP